MLLVAVFPQIPCVVLVVLLILFLVQRPIAVQYSMSFACQRSWGTAEVKFEIWTTTGMLLRSSLHSTMGECMLWIGVACLRRLYWVRPGYWLRLGVLGTRWNWRCHCLRNDRQYWRSLFRNRRLCTHRIVTIQRWTASSLQAKNSKACVKCLLVEPANSRCLKAVHKVGRMPLKLDTYRWQGWWRRFFLRFG